MGRSSAILLVALGLAACGGGAPADRRPVEPERPSVMFPGPEYEAAGARLFDAEQVLVRRCMAARGWPATPAAPALPAPPSADAAPTAADGYGLAARFARVDPRALRAASAPAAGRRTRPAYERALNGTGTALQVSAPGGAPLRFAVGGCAARATARLYGGLRAYYGALARRNVVADALNASLLRDAGLARAGRAWRRCMATQGRPARSPLDARQRVYDRYLRGSRAAARARERSVAGADRRCADTSGLYVEQARAQRDALAGLSARHRGWVRGWARLRAAAERRAASLAVPGRSDAGSRTVGNRR